MNESNKRFPADNKKEFSFLSDKKIDGELYAYFQSISKAGDKVGETPDGKSIYDAKLIKKDIPTQAEVCKIIGIKSPKTYRVHLNYLIDSGYLIDKDDHYVLPNLEDYYLLIPKDTLDFLLNVVKTPVIKTYVLLGTMWNWKKDKYEFSLTEVAKHLGLNPTKADNLKIIQHYLIALQDFQLIQFQDINKEINNMNYPFKKLTYFTLKKPELNVKNGE